MIHLSKHEQVLLKNFLYCLSLALFTRVLVVHHRTNSGVGKRNEIGSKALREQLNVAQRLINGRVEQTVFIENHQLND